MVAIDTVELGVYGGGINEQSLPLGFFTTPVSRSTWSKVPRGK